MEAGIPRLKKLHVYLTDKCNNRCAHCWVEAGPNRTARLRADQIKEQIDRSIPLGLRVVKLTGGEPFLFRDTLIDVLRHSVDRGLETRLETNATLVTERDSQVLNELGVTVSASLDGAFPGTHDSFRCRAGSFERTVRGIEHLTNHHVQVQVISCICRDNLAEVDRIIKLAVDMGACAIKFNFPSPYGRGKALERDSKLLGTEQIIRMTEYIEINYHGLIAIDIDVPRVFRVYPHAGKRCQVLNLISILPDGTYSLCGIGVTHREIAFGHLDHDNVDDVWRENARLREMRDTIPHNGKGICGDCTEYDTCYSHCLAYCLTEFKSLNGPHPICQDALDLGMFPKVYRRLG
jgi:SynChlorMet cassette radical SAM/SPASM protein ScmF